MRTLMPVVLCIVGLSLVGCAAHRTIEVGTKLSKDGGAGSGLRANENVVMHVKEGKRDYYALIGIDTANRGEYARGVVRNSTTTIEIVEGFMYLTGHYPIGATQNVIAAASGSTVVFELGKDYERIYFLCTGKPTETVNVSLVKGKQPVPGGKKAQTLVPGTYVKVTRSNKQIKLDDPQPIPGAPDPIHTFLLSVNEAAKEANLPCCPNPGP